MGFIFLLFAFLLGLVSVIGIIAAIIGVVFLILYFVRRRTKKGTISLVLAIVLLIVGIPLSLVFPLMYSAGNNFMVNSSVDEAQYPVNNAIRKKDHSRLEKLLEKGADPNESLDQNPAIFFASGHWGYPADADSVKILMRYKADIHVRDSNGDSLMKDILAGERQAGDESDLFEIITVLFQSGYDSSEKDSNGVSLLMYAQNCPPFNLKSNYHLKITKLLLKHGADLHATDNKGRTVLMWACGSELSPYGGNDAAKKPSVEKRNTFAPFDIDLINYLISLGIDVKSKDNNGYTALDYFRQTQENAKGWSEYQRVGQTDLYKTSCKVIEKLLVQQ